MRAIIAVFLLAFCASALAVDVTISLTAAQANRVGAALGKSLDLKDGNGLPRSATVAEARAYLLKVLKDMVRAVETQAAQKTALEAVNVSDLDVQ